MKNIYKEIINTRKKEPHSTDSNIQIINMKASFFCLVAAITLFATASAMPSNSGVANKRALVDANGSNSKRKLIDASQFSPQPTEEDLKRFREEYPDRDPNTGKYTKGGY